MLHKPRLCLSTLQCLLAEASYCCDASSLKLSNAKALFRNPGGVGVGWGWVGLGRFGLQIQGKFRVHDLAMTQHTTDYGTDRGCKRARNIKFGHL